MVEHSGSQWLTVETWSFIVGKGSARETVLHALHYCMYAVPQLMALRTPYQKKDVTRFSIYALSRIVIQY